MSHRDKTLVEKPSGIQLNPVRDDRNGGLTSCIKSKALSDPINHVEIGVQNQIILHPFVVSSLRDLFFVFCILCYQCYVPSGTCDKVDPSKTG